jgi:hypothetical protein
MEGARNLNERVAQFGLLSWSRSYYFFDRSKKRELAVASSLLINGSCSPAQLPQSDAKLFFMAPWGLPIY